MDIFFLLFSSPGARCTVGKTVDASDEIEKSRINANFNTPLGDIINNDICNCPNPNLPPGSIYLGGPFWCFIVDGQSVNQKIHRNHMNLENVG